ncbi:MAG TPA: NAD-dependent epimerase/dehydratase family protein [Longimicrobiales bacterium]|nr:NAD-dependent epimerase/dehydratase family protein [Longimicrobiales bacterium]
MKRILVTGAAGQVGTELVAALRERFGADEVLATDIRQPATEGNGPFRTLDAMDAAALSAAIDAHRADTVYHLAAILSANAERNPQLAWDVNMQTLVHVLEAARERGLAVFVPSSIAAFGPDTPADPTPQDTIQRPTSMYGVTKVAGELLCDYYAQRYDIDVRGLRYPGLISYTAPPGGGTTDYAVEIFHQALLHGRYTCFLGPDTQLDMMYMPDAVRASIDVMLADRSSLRHRNAFNVSAMQVTPAVLADAIREHIPGFQVDYDVDPVRQAIADSWPRRLDDSAAREEWGWQHQYDLPRMVTDMITRLRERLGSSAAAG